VWKKEMTMEKQLVDKEPEFYIQQLTTWGGFIQVWGKDGDKFSALPRW
jgi:hypothetical protein